MTSWLSEANGVLSSRMRRKSQDYAHCLKFNDYVLKSSQTASEPRRCRPKSSVWKASMIDT